mgnify:CR=1
MSLHRYNTARDANEKEIVEALRASGIVVCTLDKPLDLLCGYKGRTVLAEVKMPRNKRGEPKAYTAAQKTFLETWTGGHALLVSVDDALNLVKHLKGSAA